MPAIARLTAVLALWPVALLAESPSWHAEVPEKHRETLVSHCAKCHGQGKKRGDFSVDDLRFSITTVQDADRWQKVLNALNSGEMPPEDERQPGAGQKTELLDDLARTLVAARRRLSDSGGRVVLRRLNRREYKNTLRDLLGVEIDVRDLPADGGTGTFDTVSASLFMSSDQFERYLEIGRRALDEAIVTGPAPVKRKVHRETEFDANRKIRAQLHRHVDAYRRARELQASPDKSPADFGFLDERDAAAYIRGWERFGPTLALYLTRPHAESGSYLTIYRGQNEESVDIPADAPPGNYVLRVCIGLTEAATPSRSFVEFGYAGTGRDVMTVLDAHQVTGTIAKPQILEIPVRIGKRTERRFLFRERRPNTREAAQSTFFDHYEKAYVGLDPALWVDWVEWEGPIDAEWPPSAHRNLFFKGQKGSEKEAYARQIIERFARRAFRGKKPAADYLEKLVCLFRSRRDAGVNFDEALKEPLSVVLASPAFLYMFEPSTDERRPLNATELAVRLSYFLWSAPPDDELQTLAMTGALKDPTVLPQQVDRLLDSPRSHEFVTGFVGQWLDLKRLDFFQFDYKRYYDFDESTKRAAKEEVFEFVQTLLRENLSIRCLLKSDFVTVNALLATYYGIAEVQGDQFRKVEIPPDSPRGGLLGMAAILAMGSNGERTSPVERGAWVLRKLWNEPPPPAPPNVPQISRLNEKLLTTRDRLQAHQQEPQCASCHRKIDPIGLALENFDAAGRWRTKDSYEKPVSQQARRGKGSTESGIEWQIDASGGFHKGPAFQDYFELRNVISNQPERLARALTEAIIEYGLGRPFGFADDELAANMFESARREEFSVRALIHALVQSAEFQSK